MTNSSGLLNGHGRGPPRARRCFPDRTEDVVRSLIHHKILSDHGFSYQDEDEPDTAFMRDLRRSHEAGSLPPLPPIGFGDGEF